MEKAKVMTREEAMQSIGINPNFVDNFFGMSRIEAQVRAHQAERKAATTTRQSLSRDEVAEFLGIGQDTFKRMFGDLV